MARRRGPDAQDLRIEGATLGLSDDASERLRGRAALHRLLEDFPDDWQVAWAHELLGDSYRKDQDLNAAEDHYRACIALGDVSGTTGAVELSLAEVLFEKDDPDALAEARELILLDKWQRTPLWNSQRFRLHLLSARLEARMGDREGAAADARAALALADEEAQIPRHADVGLARPDAQTVTELERLAGDLHG